MEKKKTSFLEIVTFLFGCIGLIGVIATVIGIYVTMTQPAIVIKILGDIGGIGGIVSPTPLVEYISNPTYTANPTYTQFPTYTIHPTNSPFPTNTNTPEPTNTPKPTSTLTPTPGGISTAFGDEQLQVILVDYDFRSSSNNNDNGAVGITIVFSNETDQNIEVVLNIMGISAVDNLGIQYGELNAVGARNCANSGFGCVWGAPDASKLEKYSFVVPAGGTKTLDLELHIEGESMYDPTRVDIATNWIDLDFPNIQYRTDELYIISAEWRLIR